MLAIVSILAHFIIDILLVGIMGILLEGIIKGVKKLSLGFRLFKTFKNSTIQSNQG